MLYIPVSDIEITIFGNNIIESTDNVHNILTICTGTICYVYHHQKIPIF